MRATWSVERGAGTELQRSLGLADCVLLSVGAMVGLGVTEVVWSGVAFALIAGYLVVRHARHADALEPPSGPTQ